LIESYYPQSDRCVVFLGNNGTVNRASHDLALLVTETEQGLSLTWRYSTDLFETRTIQKMSSHFETLLGSIVEQPEARLNALEILTEAEKQQQQLEQQKREQANRKKFKFVKPKAVTLPQENPIKTSYLQSGQTLPLVVEPDVEDLDRADWARSNRDWIETNLLQHGAILLRGFQGNSVTDFEQFAQGICPELFGEYGDLPRISVSGKVYGSTPYPPDKAILFHLQPPGYSRHIVDWR
jgi:hypothetical protein